MAGARIEIDNRQVLAALDALLERTGDVDPVLRDIGEHLLNTTHERFEREVDPSGQPWAPLDPVYAARKARERPNAGILVYDDYLRGTLRYQVSGDELALGTDRIYGAVHQETRPFLGLSATDEEDILGILSEYLSGAI